MAVPESFVHGGTNTDEKCSWSRHFLFHSQLSPQPPDM
jgi:hypothetical protein